MHPHSLTRTLDDTHSLIDESLAASSLTLTDRSIDGAIVSAVLTLVDTTDSIARDTPPSRPTVRPDDDRCDGMRWDAMRSMRSMRSTGYGCAALALRGCVHVCMCVYMCVCVCVCVTLNTLCTGQTLSGPSISLSSSLCLSDAPLSVRSSARTDGASRRVDAVASSPSDRRERSQWSRCGSDSALRRVSLALPLSSRECECRLSE